MTCGGGHGVLLSSCLSAYKSAYGKDLPVCRKNGAEIAESVMKEALWVMRSVGQFQDAFRKERLIATGV